jgi:predicted secreted protein
MSLQKILVSFVVAMIISLLNGSCTSRTLEAAPAPKEVQLSQKGGACGSGVGINQGDTLVLVMDGETSPGYRWEVGFFVPVVIKPEDEQESQTDSDRFTISENQSFRFLAVGEGQAELLMIYEPFDTDLANPESCQVDVTVSGLGT